MIEIYHRPGINMSEMELSQLHQELMSVANECLETIPDYQCLSGKKSEYDRLIIAVSRDGENKIDGFCSSYILEAEGLGNILHLGLTCVGLRARGLGLTHQLTGKVIIHYILKYSFFRPVWISNVACVLSSLGNVAMHFEDVYPSPFMKTPNEHHVKMANYINDNFRQELYINADADFCEKEFVFKNSVTGTMFEKSAEDSKFHHRNSMLNEFYKGLINFENGDEVLQIGKVSLLTYPKYLLRNLKLKSEKYLSSINPIMPKAGGSYPS